MLRKISLAVWTASLVLYFIGPSLVAAQFGIPTPHKAGSLIVLDKTIYLVGYGNKRGFPSLNEFLTYNYRWSRILPGNAADRDLINAPPMHAKPGTLALDTGDNRTIYLIGKQGEKRGFISAVALQKYRKKKTVIWPINLSAYPIGENIE